MIVEKNKIQTLISQEELQQRIMNLAQEINSDYCNEEICVICVLKGAFMFCVDLIKHFNMPIRTEFIRLSSYGSSTTTSGKVHAVDIALPDLNGKHVLIVEDIIDTGLTAKFLLDFIENNFKTKTTKFCSLLDKKAQRRTSVEADYAGFEIEDKFVIGYGLDYDGYYRNLPYIGVLEM